MRTKKSFVVRGNKSRKGGRKTPPRATLVPEFKACIQDASRPSCTPKTPKRNKGGNPYLDLTVAQTKIIELNKLLRQKCPTLHLQFDFVKHLPGTLTRYTTVVGPTTRARGARLLLCLYKGNQCISSIEINLFFHGEITINSRTERQEEGKKYNKMLRAVVMMVGGLIPGITKLHSVAENPISAWLLVDNFQVEYPHIGNQDFFDYLRTEVWTNKHFSREQLVVYLEHRNMDEEPLTKKQIFDFYADKTQHNLISIKVPFHESNKDSAMKLFVNLTKPSAVDTIVCQ